MRKIRLRELSGWPPQPGGAYESGTRIPVAGEAVVTEVLPVMDAHVTFRGIFEGHPHSYDYLAADETTAKTIFEAVAANRGKTVHELGEVEIEVE